MDRAPPSPLPSLRWLSGTGLRPWRGDRSAHVHWRRSPGSFLRVAPASLRRALASPSVEISAYVVVAASSRNDHRSRSLRGRRPCRRADEPRRDRPAGPPAEGFVWVALSDPGADERDELEAALGVPRSALEGTPEGRTSVRGWSITVSSTILTVTTVRAVDPRCRSSLVRSTSSSASATRSPSASPAPMRLPVHPSAAGHVPRRRSTGPWPPAGSARRGDRRKRTRRRGARRRAREDRGGDVPSRSGPDEPIYLQLRAAARLARAMHPTVTTFHDSSAASSSRSPQALSPLLGDLSDHAGRLSEEAAMLGEALAGLLM